MEFLASSSTEAHTPKLSRIASTNPPLLSYDLPTSSPVLTNSTILSGVPDSLQYEALEQLREGDAILFFQVLILGGICYTVSCTGRVYCAMPMMVLM